MVTVGVGVPDGEHEFIACVKFIVRDGQFVDMVLDERFKHHVYMPLRPYYRDELGNRITVRMGKVTLDMREAHLFPHWPEDEHAEKAA
jgi:hypothetical protein